jgi:hypothetical protein
MEQPHERTDRTSHHRDAEGSVMAANSRWPLERVLFALAGTVTLLSALLAATVSDWFLLLTAFVGVNQWLYVLVGVCPASVFLRRACRLRSVMYAEGRAAMPGPKGAGIR